MSVLTTHHDIEIVHIWLNYFLICLHRKLLELPYSKLYCIIRLLSLNIYKIQLMSTLSRKGIKIAIKQIPLVKNISFCLPTMKKINYLAPCCLRPYTNLHKHGKNIQNRALFEEQTTDVEPDQISLQKMRCYAQAWSEQVQQKITRNSLIETIISTMTSTGYHKQ